MKGVVLAAGSGTRLQPLTLARPKALCPVGNRPLLDWALARVTPFVGEVAVNVHAHPDAMVDALARSPARLPLHVSVEAPVALGTAGALGRLRPWIDGDPVLLTNADAWYPPDADAILRDFVAGWDGERVRLLCVSVPGAGTFGDLRYMGTALLPWSSVSGLEPEPSGLYEVSWASRHDVGRLDLVEADFAAVDCGTPADYLQANLAASGGEPVVEEGAVVEGELVRSVVWAGEQVAAGECLVDAVRAAGVTLQPLRRAVTGGSRRGAKPPGE